MEYTPEQQQDFQERATAFQKEFAEFMKALSEKHECEFVYGVATVPGPNGIYGLGVQQNIGDLKYKAVPSPLTPEDVEAA
jgi:hypothetical protein